jgi:hypothetical protein
MRYREVLVLSAVLAALSTQPGRANSCSQDIDRAWAQVTAKIQARSAAGRSVPRSTIGRLKTLVDVRLPMETALAALSRARKADHANDRTACEDASRAHRVIGP